LKLWRAATSPVGRVVLFAHRPAGSRIDGRRPDRSAAVAGCEHHSFDRDAGFTASYMETLLMTETGIEVLSRLRRTLHVLPG
jgi:hypothetical protein